MRHKPHFISQGIAGVLVVASAAWIVSKDLTITENWQREQVKVWTSYNEAGDALLMQGKLNEALLARRHGLLVAKRLVSAEPGNSRWYAYEAASEQKIDKALLAGARDEHHARVERPVSPRS